MSGAQTIAQIVKDPQLVTFELLVDGKDISNTYQVITITVSQIIDKIPTAHILIVDGAPDTKNFEASSSNDFKPGKKIEIKLGYNSTNEKVFEGIIISNAIRINNDCSELNLEAKDETVKMTINNNNHHFNDKSDIDIAKELLKQNKISNTDVSVTTPKHKQLVQSNITDWDYMIGRIDINGLFCVIDNGKVTIKKPDKDNPKIKLTYGDDILELHTEMDTRIQSPEVKTMVWDFKTQKVIKEESKTSSGDNAGITDKPYEIRSSVSLTQEEMKAISDSKKLKQELSKIKGKVKYQGNKAAIAGDFITIEGVGKNFEGNIFVSAIQHEYGDGDWTTEATLGWNEQFFSEQTHSQNASSSLGQVSNMQGLQSAIVTEITDPDGEFRVKVRLPAVNDQDDGIYARVATLDAGNKRGTFFRPEVNDEVIVGFVNNDASHPVILGMLHSNTKAAPFQPESANNKKGYVSRSEIKLTFNDGEKSVLIETPGNRVFELNDSANTITVKDGTGNKITMDLSGVTIEAALNLTLKAGATLSLAAPQLAIKADGAVSMEGSGGMSLKSSGVTEIKGSLVKIN